MNRTSPLPSARRRLAERAAVFLAGVLVSVALLEAVLRLAGAVYWSSESRTVSAEEVARSLPPEATGCRGCRKILAVGDSVTYGVGAPCRELAFPGQLARLLSLGDSGARRTVVVNAGRGGSHSSAIRETLERHLQIWTPDLVLILAGGSNALSYSHLFAQARGREPWRTLEALAWRLRLYRFARYALAYRAPVHLRDLWLGQYLEFAAEAGHGAAAGQRAAPRTDAEKAHEMEERGVQLLRTGQYEEAAHVLGEAARKDPTSPEAHCGHGTAHAALGQVDEALAALRSGIMLAPWDGRCYPAFHEVIRLQGQQDRARQFLEEVGARSEVARRYSLQLMEERATADEWVRRDLTQMVELVRRRGARAVLVQYPTLNEVNAVIREVAAERSVPTVATHETFQAALTRGEAQASLFIPDGHPNGRGYGLMARAIYRRLRQERIFDLPAEPAGEAACPSR